MAFAAGSRRGVAGTGDIFAFRGDPLDTIVSYLTRKFSRFEVIVVDDGSTDDTAAQVDAFEDARVRCVTMAGNQGTGASVRRGVLESSEEVILFSDADLSTPIEELELLLESLQSGHDVVIASRWLNRNQDVQRSRGTVLGTSRRPSRPPDAAPKSVEATMP